MHDGRRDYVCDRKLDDGSPCGVSFGQAGSLNKHIAVVHESRRDYVCDRKHDAVWRGVWRGWKPQEIATVHESRRDYVCDRKHDDGKPCEGDVDALRALHGRAAETMLATTDHGSTLAQQ